MSTCPTKAPSSLIRVFGEQASPWQTTRRSGSDPAIASSIREEMFTFDDLASLDAAGLQTLLSAADRAALVIALKGARDDTANAFFGNMTRHAGNLLREEIAALGPVRRADVEAARQELVTLARTLVHRGDIRSGDQTDEDELVD